MQRAAAQTDELTLSQLSLRKGLGILGLALPIIFLIVCGFSPTLTLQRSLSAFYYVPHLRDLLVGILWAIGAFLVFYRGYSAVPKAFHSLPVWLSRHLTDAILTTVAGIGALATAMLPTCEFRDHCDGAIVAGLHLAGSVTFLGTLGVLSIWSFTESDTPPSAWDAEKRWSNHVYTICGWTILVTVVACGLVLAFDITTIGPVSQPVFWLESLAIWAFGISWLTKGRAIQGAEFLGQTKAITPKNQFGAPNFLNGEIRIRSEKSPMSC